MFPQGFYVLTPIIDEEQTILEKTEAALGAGRPLIGGDQYRAVTAELRTVATDMNRACLLATAWQGLAGIAFAAEIQVYTNVVNQMALLHSAAAQCVDAQAVAVLQARKGLEHLAFRLVVCQIEARNAALAGNMAAVLEIQEAAVDEVEPQRKGVVAVLANSTAVHAARMNAFSATLTRLAETLGGSTLDSAAGSAVTIEPAKLTLLASSLSNCSAAMIGLVYGAPWIVSELRLTHGDSLTRGFNAAVAIFEQTRDEVLTLAHEKVDARAADLSDAAGMYAECDESSGSECEEEF